MCSILQQVSRRTRRTGLPSGISESTVFVRWYTCNWNAKGYRLPTEAEWEYSARGGEYHKYAGSNNVDEVLVWCQQW